MNKNEFKAKWGKYCDTDNLVDEMCEMYKANNHLCSVNGMCEMLDTFFTNKEPLIKLFATSNHYIGNMRIAIKKDFERQISYDEIALFMRDIREKLYVDELLQFTDASGKTVGDYLITGVKSYNLDNLPNNETQKTKKAALSVFEGSTFATAESKSRRDMLINYMGLFARITSSTLKSNIESNQKNAPPILKAGTKTSRAFNTVCTHYGVDKLHPIETTDANGNKRVTYPYNKVFAQYSDLVSDLVRQMYFIISVNPLDYLMMSNGVSWQSCHNIRSGGYKGGTLSYMLDTTSMVTFVVNEISDKIHALPRFYRQMIHYENNMFVQNRLYPQGNDGAVDLYDKFRGFVIEEFAELLDLDETDWTVDKGKNQCSKHTHSIGRHYTDYLYNNSCNVFYPASKRDIVRQHVMTIGHSGICAKCGREYSHSAMLSHGRGDCKNA